MAEPFTVQKWRANDGTLHDTETAVTEYEARVRLVARRDAVLAQIGALQKAPPHYEEDPEACRVRMAFNSGARAAIEAAIKAGLIKEEG